MLRTKGFVHTYCTQLTKTFGSKRPAVDLSLTVVFCSKKEFGISTVCMYICMYVRMGVCRYVCIYVSICVCVCVMRTIASTRPSGNTDH